MAKPATGTKPDALFGLHKADAQAQRAAVARPRRPLIIIVRRLALPVSGTSLLSSMRCGGGGGGLRREKQNDAK